MEKGGNGLLGDGNRPCSGGTSYWDYVRKDKDLKTINACVFYAKSHWLPIFKSDTKFPMTINLLSETKPVSRKILNDDHRLANGANNRQLEFKKQTVWFAVTKIYLVASKQVTFLLG